MNKSDTEKIEEILKFWFEETTPKQKFEKDVFGEQKEVQGSETLSNALTGITKLEELYGAGTENSLSLGKESVGVGGLLARGKRKGQLAFDQKYTDRLTAYKNQVSFIAGILNQARGAGVLNEGEYEVMLDNIPGEYSTDTQATGYFSNMKDIIRRMSEVGINTPTYMLPDIGQNPLNYAY